MKAVLPLLIGICLGAALAQWYIIATREPMSCCAMVAWKASRSPPLLDGWTLTTHGHG